MIVMSLIAPLAGMFYREPRMVAVLQVLSASFLISGLGILHQALLERSLSFDSLAKLEITSVSVGAILGIGLAFANAGVWSLVFQSVIASAATTLFLWLSSSWRPKWIFSWEEVKRVSDFSLNLTGFNIFNYFIRNADYLLIGHYLGAQDLGYYTRLIAFSYFPFKIYLRSLEG